MSCRDQGQSTGPIRATTVGELVRFLRDLPPDRPIVATFDEIPATGEGVACAELIIGALAPKDEGPWEDEDPRHYAHRMGDRDV